MSVGNYHELQIWQKSMELAEVIYKTTCEFPAWEKFGLVSQLRRAAVSIPSNIAEGNMRNSDKDFLRFINMALGSLAEMETQLELAKRVDYLVEENVGPVQTRVSELAKMLRGMQVRLKESIH